MAILSDRKGSGLSEISDHGPCSLMLFFTIISSASSAAAAFFTARSKRSLRFSSVSASRLARKTLSLNQG